VVLEVDDEASRRRDDDVEGADAADGRYRALLHLRLDVVALAGLRRLRCGRLLGWGRGSAWRRQPSEQGEGSAEGAPVRSRTVGGSRGSAARGGLPPSMAGGRQRGGALHIGDAGLDG